MFNALVLALTILSSLFLIIFILLHSGKGGGLSDMFGGGAGLSGGTSVERTLEVIRLRNRDQAHAAEASESLWSDCHAFVTQRVRPLLLRSGNPLGRQAARPERRTAGNRVEGCGAPRPSPFCGPPPVSVGR